MDRIELAAKTRDILGKKVRFLRRQGLTPVNLYGHNIESTPLQVETSELKRTLARAGKTRLIELKVNKAKSPRMVIIREIQREPLSGDLFHIDLYQVRMDEKIKLQVPLLLVGVAPAVRDRGGILVQNMSSVEIECLPANMPHGIEVDISSLVEIDQALHVKDLHVSNDITILSDPDKSITRIARMRVEVAVEAVVKEAAVEEAAEGAKTEAAESAEESKER